MFTDNVLRELLNYTSPAPVLSLACTLIPTWLKAMLTR